MGKNHTDYEATTAFKRAILLSEHSVIRELIVKWRWTNIKSFIATHFSRHKWECYISTQRTDRTNVDREKSPQNTPVNMDCTANEQHLIDMARKRLCRQSENQTRGYMEDLKVSISQSDKIMSDVLVPNCVYRCGCPEMNNCGYFDYLCKMNPSCKSTDIQERYDAYNEMFHSHRGEKHEE